MSSPGSMRRMPGVRRVARSRMLPTSSLRAESFVFASSASVRIRSLGYRAIRRDARSRLHSPAARDGCHQSAWSRSTARSAARPSGRPQRRGLVRKPRGHRTPDGVRTTKTHPASPLGLESLPFALRVFVPSCEETRQALTTRWPSASHLPSARNKASPPFEGRGSRGGIEPQGSPDPERHHPQPPPPEEEGA